MTAPRNSTEAVAARLTEREAKILDLYAAGGTTVDGIADQTGTRPAEVTRVINVADNDRRRARALMVAWLDSNRIETAAAASEDTIANLIERAVASEAPRLIRLANKIGDLVDQLETQVTEYERTAALRTEADELAARLAEIQGQLTPRRTAAAGEPVSKADSRAIRDWAARTGLTCGSSGRIPASVLDAYAKRGQQ